MSNTAFLQLTIVLVSIVSRTSSIASALLDITSSITPYIYAVFETLEPPRSLVNKISKRLKKSHSTPTPKDPIEPPTKSTLNSQTPAPVYMDNTDEDLGLSIARGTLPPTTVSALRPSPPIQFMLVPDSLTSPTLLTPLVETTTPLSPPSPPPSQPPRAQVIPKKVPAEPPAHAVPVATSTKPKKKRKKVRDEIDEIFG
ncbi:unnamed protein product [Rhizoctonia solani]|uniref:Uncharacterized protein n=1 Tax=Rhizoctonia solani TaxID=456999 RepID=A0A8H3D8Q9_9AGAM|nr:unnamed protein product [Rhizoctonia solani]